MKVYAKLWHESIVEITKIQIVAREKNHAHTVQIPNEMGSIAQTNQQIKTEHTKASKK